MFCFCLSFSISHPLELMSMLNVNRFPFGKKKTLSLVLHTHTMYRAKFQYCRIDLFIFDNTNVCWLIVHHNMRFLFHYFSIYLLLFHFFVLSLAISVLVNTFPSIHWNNKKKIYSFQSEHSINILFSCFRCLTSIRTNCDNCMRFIHIFSIFDVFFFFSRIVWINFVNVKWIK